ncbi:MULTISPECIES: hypothetical protein [Nocardia]|uniref:hypothetical protein n=1 Tax=Nocardia TaxID=1817 RepID=UPI000D696043|nr:MULTISPECIES: hypothetical protein [Nocardia]
MTTAWDELPGDWADRAVNFGGYQFHTLFDRRSPHYQPLPDTPPPSAVYERGDRCLCAHCASEGLYAACPLCRFWRAHCDVCAGRRRYRDFGTRREMACDDCLDMWRTEVSHFREALRSPAAAARALRAQRADALAHRT